MCTIFILTSHLAPSFGKTGAQKLQDNSIKIANVNFIFLGDLQRTLLEFCDLYFRWFFNSKTTLFAIENLDGPGGGADLILHGPFGCNEVCALVMLWLFWPIPIIQTHTFCRSLQLLSFGKWPTLWMSWRKHICFLENHHHHNLCSFVGLAYQGRQGCCV